MPLISEISQHDTELVLKNSIENLRITFKDDNGIPAIPELLSVELKTLDDSFILKDTYLPLTDRNPNPPRILNPEIGVYEFPIGLDNGSTNSSKKNKTNNEQDLLLIWRAARIASIKASIIMDPNTVGNALLTWTSVASGTPGNFISIEYVDPGIPNAALSVERDGPEIKVNLATNVLSAITTTANDIIAEVNNTTDVSEHVLTTLPIGSVGTGVVAAISKTFLINGRDASEEDILCTNVKIISTKICSLIGKFRLLIDKTIKIYNTDPDDPCYLGHSDGQLVQYLTSGLQIINSYQPSGTFSLSNFPFNDYDFILMETSLLAGMMTQSMYAIDNDIPNWNDQGNAFVITHYPQLAQYLNWLAARLDKLIPLFKLNFVSAGSLHIQAGPNFRLAQLVNASPTGSLFRNFFAKTI